MANIKNQKYQKHKKYQAIIDTTFNLTTTYGIEGVTISLIAKHSHISRSWIYKYVGRNITEVLRFTLKDSAEKFSRLEEMSEHCDKKQMLESIYSYTQGMVEQIKLKPAILKLYLIHRNNQNMVGDIIREVESRYSDILSKNIENCFLLNPHQARTRADMIHFMRMGSIMLYFSKIDRHQDGAWEQNFWSEFYSNLKTMILDRPLIT